jgi:hypothetical protein
MSAEKLCIGGHNTLKSTRTLSFKPDGGGGLIVTVSERNINVRVTLKVESEDYNHAQMVLDALTALCEDQQCLMHMAGEPTDDEVADAEG